MRRPHAGSRSGCGLCGVRVTLWAFGESFPPVVPGPLLVSARPEKTFQGGVGAARGPGSHGWALTPLSSRSGVTGSAGLPGPPGEPGFGQRPWPERRAGPFGPPGRCAVSSQPHCPFAASSGLKPRAQAYENLEKNAFWKDFQRSLFLRKSHTAGLRVVIILFLEFGRLLVRAGVFPTWT